MRLPVVSLLRFKSVCKSWLSLIESSFFTDLPTATTLNSSSSKFGSFIFHAAVSKTLRNPSDKYENYGFLTENAVIMLSSKSESESFFGSSSGSESGSGGWCWVTSDQLRENSDDYDDDQVFKVDNNNNNIGGGGGGGSNDDDDDQQLVFKLDNLGFPSCYKFNGSSRVIGSCNGLICLVYRFDDGVNLDYSLWNPATKQFRILPKSITIEYEDKYVVEHSTAFGFDVETKDYKVVLVTGSMWNGLGPMDSSCHVQVYSLSTDSWRPLNGITSLPGHLFVESFQGLYLNGSCFFMATHLHTTQQMCFPKNDRFIISFDLTKEIITTIEIPDHDIDQKLYLCYLGDKLALFTVSTPPLTMEDANNINLEIDFHQDFEIWVLNEHVGGSCSSSSSSSVNKESWTKLHSFRINGGDTEISYPIGISNDGEFAIIQTLDVMCTLSKKMRLYNLVTKEVKKDFLCCNEVVSKAAYVYKPSLVSIIGGNGCSSSSGSIG